MPADHIQVGIRIPDGVRFADLKMGRDTDGMVSVDQDVLRAICAHSDIDHDLLIAHEDNLSTLYTEWYAMARSAGEPADAVMDDLIAEAAAEDALGDGLSRPPGTS